MGNNDVTDIYAAGNDVPEMKKWLQIFAAQTDAAGNDLPQMKRWLQLYWAEFDAADNDVVEMKRWLEIFAAIRAKEQEIENWTAMPEPLPSEALIKKNELSRLHSELADLRAQVATTPAPVVPASEARQAEPQAAPVMNTKARRRSWWEISSAYIVEVMQDGQYATAKELYRALEAKAGPNAPFVKGTGASRGSLFVREIAQPLCMKTVQNKWRELRELAGEKMTP